MNRHKMMLLMFGCLAVIQISVPVSMIIRQESILAAGPEYRFKTAPVDPFDAFRGRYVAIRLLEDRVPYDLSYRDLTQGQRVFALIASGSDGFSRFSGITAKEPKNAPYLAARISYKDAKNVYLRFPIDRYYMDELKAPKADELYSNRGRDNRQNAYVVVAIVKGSPVVKKLIIGDKPIESAVREEINKKRSH